MAASPTQATPTAPAGDTTIEGWTWADGTPVKAVTVKAAKEDKKLTAATPLPYDTKQHQNWSLLLDDGTAIGLSGEVTAQPPSPFFGLIALREGKTVNALNPSADPFATSRSSFVQEDAEHPGKGGPFPSLVAAAGKGFVFASTETFNGFGSDSPSTTLYRVDAVGGIPVKLATIEHPTVDGIRDRVKDLAVGPDETGAQRVYWTEGTTVREGTLRSMPLAGGALRTEGKGLEHPMPSAAGLFVERVEYAEPEALDTVTAIGTMKDGTFTPVLAPKQGSRFDPGSVSLSPDGGSLAIGEKIDVESDASARAIVVNPGTRAATVAAKDVLGGTALDWHSSAGRWVSSPGQRLTILGPGGAHTTTITGTTSTLAASLFRTADGGWSVLNVELAWAGDDVKPWVASLGGI